MLAPDTPRVVDRPRQIAAVVGVTVITGKGFTVTNLDAVFVHPVTVLVPVTVYVTVVVGDAVTVAPVVAVREVAGVQEYVLPPLADSVEDAPRQNVTVAGVIAIVGLGFTVMTSVAVFVQPVTVFVPVTVYVVVVVGDAVTVAPVVALSPVAGVHT